VAETEFIASACATFGEISCEKGAYQDMHIGSKLGLVIIQGSSLGERTWKRRSTDNGT
jgi:hypothetical protein